MRIALEWAVGRKRRPQSIFIAPEKIDKAIGKQPGDFFQRELLVVDARRHDLEPSPR